MQIVITGLKKTPEDLKIRLGDLKDKAEELTSFLEPRVGAKPSSGGSEIDIEDSKIREGVRPRHVKTYIKRFLHKAGQRKDYRVLVVGSELSIVHLERGPEEEAPKAQEKKEEAPTPEPAKEEEPKKEAEAKPTEPKKRPRKAAKKPES